MPALPEILDAATQRRCGLEVDELSSSRPAATSARCLTAEPAHPTSPLPGADRTHSDVESCEPGNGCSVWRMTWPARKGRDGAPHRAPD